MKKLAILAATGAVLAGCTHSAGGPHEHMVFPGVRPASDDTAVYMAEEICEADGLNQQRADLLQRAYDMREMVAEYEYGRDTSLQTRVIELVNAFETDLQGTYTSVQTSCRTYSVCMHQNGYQEASCNQTRLEWREARDDFYNLSNDLAEIRLAIVQSCSDCREDLDGIPDHRGHRGHGAGHGSHPSTAHHHHGHQHRYDIPIGSVFSAPTTRDH
jgi:hypothetical protein